MDQDTLFLQKQLREFGLENASEEERDAFFASAGQEILTEVARKIGVQLPEDKREEFFGLFERPSTDEEKAAFFSAYVPNFKDLLVEEVARFKSEVIKHAAEKNRIDASPEIK